MLLITAIAVLVLLFSSHLALITSAALASGPLNPNGSQVLAQVTPVEQRALVFSLKQCTTPAGGALAGIVLPPVMLADNWQMAIPIIVVAAVLFSMFSGLPDPLRATSSPQTPTSKSAGKNTFSLRKNRDSLMQF